MSTPENAAAATPGRLDRAGAVARARLAQWRLWWTGLSLRQRWLPAICVAAYWALLLAVGGLRADHVRVGLLVVALALAGPGAREALRLLLPLALTGVIYDSRRFWPSGIRGPVHVAEPYSLEKQLFGIPTAGGILTPPEWWQIHTSSLLDAVTGAFYLGFIPSFVVLAAWFTFRVGRTGTRKRSAAYVREHAPRMMWALLWLNLLGFVTAHLYPAAPPWYVAEHGLGPPDSSARPGPAGCARFEALFGTRVFTSFYGRSVDLFGAIPSLHVAYPLLAAWFAFRLGAARAFALAIYLGMCFSAVYLNHHYVIDVLAGSACALLVGAAGDAIHAWRAHRDARPVESSVPD